MTTFETTIQSEYFPISKPMVGHFIPGELKRYPTKLVNYPDGTSAVVHRKPSVIPFQKDVRPPEMNGELTKNHKMIKLLKQILEKKKSKHRPN